MQFHAPKPQLLHHAPSSVSAIRAAIPWLECMGDVPHAASRLSFFGIQAVDAWNAEVGVKTCMRAGSIAGMGGTSFFVLGCGFMA